MGKKKKRKNIGDITEEKTYETLLSIQYAERSICEIMNCNFEKGG